MRNKVILLKLKRGLTQYDVKLGAVRRVLKIVPAAGGGAVVTLVVDQSLDSNPCVFEVVGFDESATSAFVGKVTEKLFLFSNCIGQLEEPIG